MLHAHGAHAAVVHGGNASAHDDRAQHQLPGVQLCLGQQGDGNRRCANAGNDGKNGQRQVILHNRMGTVGQHANEMHGPYAGAQRQRSAGNRPSAQMGCDG